MFNIPFMGGEGASFIPDLSDTFSTKMGDLNQQYTAGESKINFGVSGNQIAIVALVLGVGIAAFMFFKRR